MKVHKNQTLRSRPALVYRANGAASLFLAVSNFPGVRVNLPVLNLIPGQLADDPTVEGKAYATLSQRGLVSADEWNAFLQDPNHILVQGRAYHPRYYRGYFFRPGNARFRVDAA